MIRLLTIESTCDETAAAVVDDQLNVLSSVVASQSHLHDRYGGVVPEIASRAHVERIMPVIDQALRQAQVDLADLDAIAVANQPGLAGSLLVGLIAAKTLSFAHDIPLIAIDHLQAHIYACQIDSGLNVFPCVGLIVSGGHSNLYRCETALDFTPLGSTIDDAAGEAFDKVASMLGLGYPGGPAIQKAAENGNPKRFKLPRPLKDNPERLDFSFSGLKTAVRYELFGPGKVDPEAIAELDPQRIADMAASFQDAVVDCLIAKSELALIKTGFQRLCIGGGVAANSHFRQRIADHAGRIGYELFIPPLKLCTDNAVMGAIAVERYRAGLFEQLSLDICPGLVRH
ncbi:tRNA (adenosine(37)-N6)-threonylcarbamoyltransferase complex transferase subunit TsaD [Bythopirellula polymerisocia]|uniref:tRNA N6-adenosine threonylcarbamoyltransferase n=1 Tax=Bythopirellula polymerisocia TaxID=2528003 RepID=A0A5C6CYD2_9BACT|nr:tRNA (adenosine(37)-N6)-threonylcarbamoyltransferase complex transferase subunit TsaD [Bythopirellula polymerisocia]TWU28491.1 tRNA N6-adenosine threonylcarbamoyltransferase [Bythopirellula polymerisocia]